ncbi:MAG: hypothetical protein MI976_24860 [Pseudomonadales bacterium]|nr:hypothetical protein [Pseudomonadales bacterium]
MRLVITLLLSLGFFLQSSVCHSEWAWDVSGFASIGAGKLNREGLTFIDYEDEWSFDSDTVLGLQTVIEPTATLSLTGQLVTRGYTFDAFDGEEYTTKIEWLFAAYELDDTSRIRVGRLRTPHQYYAESLEVGYTYLWTRPPVDGHPFQFEPFTHFDGIDYITQFAFDDFDIDLRLLAGSTEGRFYSNKVNVNASYGFNVLTRWQDLTVRYGFINFRSDIKSDLLEPMKQAAQLAPIIPIFEELSDQYQLEDGWLPYHNLAVVWHLENWQFLAEGFRLYDAGKQLTYSSRGWYVSVARQFNELTPYLGFGAYKGRLGKEIFENLEIAKQQLSEFIAGIPLAALPAYAPQIEAIQRFIVGGEAGTRGYWVEQHSYTLGMRYDFHPKAAIKFEVQYFEFAEGSTGHMIRDSYEGRINDAALTSIVLDLVF